MDVPPRSRALAALVCAQLVRVAKARNPLADLKLSAASFTNAPPVAVAKTNESVQKPTNSPPVGSRSPSAVRPELPAAVQARVDKIVQSEILGSVVRPLPMALLGIAGKDAFLRGPDGQTGLVREGEELGAVKVLRIATNRVLIEHDDGRHDAVPLVAERQHPSTRRWPLERHRPRAGLRGRLELQRNGAALAVHHLQSVDRRCRFVDVQGRRQLLQPDRSDRRLDLPFGEPAVSVTRRGTPLAGVQVGVHQLGDGLVAPRQRHVGTLATQRVARQRPQWTERWNKEMR